MAKPRICHDKPRICHGRSRICHGRSKDLTWQIQGCRGVMKQKEGETQTKKNTEVIVWFMSLCNIILCFWHRPNICHAEPSICHAEPNICHAEPNVCHVMNRNEENKYWEWIFGTLGSKNRCNEYCYEWIFDQTYVRFKKAPQALAGGEKIGSLFQMNLWAKSPFRPML